MAIKYDTLGLLIYIALTANILAWVAMLSTHFPRRFRAIRWGVYPHVFVTRLTKIGWAFFALGFVASAGGVLMRGLSTGQPPMRNMFEVMMFIAAVMFPLSVFCRLVLRVGSCWADALLAAVLLVPVGFVFSAEVAHLPPVLQNPLFGPHVATYLLAYAILAKAAVQAVALLRISRRDATSQPLSERSGELDRMVRLGFPLLTMGLCLGAIWGKLAWGDYWNWDPKEMWSLATWLIFAGYFHLPKGSRADKLRAWVALAGFAMTIITLLWVNFSKLFAGLHNYAS